MKLFKVFTLAVLLFSLATVTFAESLGQDGGATGNVVFGRSNADNSWAASGAGKNTAFATDNYGRVLTLAGNNEGIGYVTPGIDTSQYQSGECVGGWVTVADVVKAPFYAGSIRRVVLSDKAAQGVNYDLVCTTATAPTAASCTDQAAFDPVDGELPDMFVIPLTSHTAFADNGMTTSGDLNHPIKLTTTTLKCALVVRGAPTYASSSDLRLNLYVDQY